ncbi:Oidioi.mRNA.OKI2018_I69.chr1.g643.t1.cds [Oikopleura dioica]|uniref:Oidioi.mRNA.OKI2018_I69.chr1.g643.t1.cds n=1 Tax=Oikopleura dioica TaxID=34765 RepID=A0ABN7SUQ1_OIKDI|nr:Oidioi.mRNA.OKI2018_I69.chr1.g643.t1.cds [Oikopleura dioica]
MKLSNFVLSSALAQRDPNYKYNKRVVEGLSGTDCNTNNLTIAKFSDDIKCAEGEFIPEESMCTLQCVSEGTAPVFAELLCRKGELHPLDS